MLMIVCKNMLQMWGSWQNTVGVIKNGTLIFVNFWAQGASILKISVPIIKRRSWCFQNTPNSLNLIDFKPSYSILKKMEDLQKLGSYSIFGATSFFVVILANNTHQKVDFWGCLRILRNSSLSPRISVEDYRPERWCLSCKCFDLKRTSSKCSARRVVKWRPLIGWNLSATNILLPQLPYLNVIERKYKS